MSIDSTLSSLQLATVKKPQKIEQPGYIEGFFLRKATDWTSQKGSIKGIEATPVHGTWSGLLHDLSRFIVKDQAGLENHESLVNNLSLIVQQVVLAMGTVRSRDRSPGFNDDEFVKDLASNIIKIITDSKHDFSSCRSEEEQKRKLSHLFEELIKCAGLDREHIKEKPYLVQQAFYPDLWAKAALGVYRYTYADLPPISKDAFEQKFIKGMMGVLRIQKRLSAKSKDPILSLNEGSSEAVDRLVVEIIIKRLRTGKLVLDHKYLNIKENKVFLNAIINKVMSEQEPEVENQEIRQAWTMIEGQIKMALKAILAVVLTPPEGQNPIEFRNALFVEILNRLGDHKELLNKKIARIEAKDKENLVNDLSETVGPRKRGALELLSRKDVSWDREALEFIDEAWSCKFKSELSHRDLSKILDNWEKEAENNSKNWKLSYSEKALSLLKRQNVSWEDEARQFLKRNEYIDTVRSVLSRELRPEKFKEYIPTFFKAEDLLEQVYESIAEVALEIHEQQKYLEREGAEALSFIETGEISELSEFFDELMEGLVETVDELADKNRIDLGFGKFLNEPICYLLSDKDIFIDSDNDLESSEMNAFDGRKFAKDEVIAIVKNLLMITLRNAIEKNTGEGKQSEAFSRLVENFFRDAIERLSKVGELCRKFAFQELFEKKQALEELLKVQPHVKIEIEDEKMKILYRQLLVRDLARDLLEKIMPKELFDKLLSPTMRNFGLWEMFRDKMVPFLEGISITLDAYEEASKIDPKNAKSLKLAGDTGHLLKPLIGKLTEKVIQNVSSIRLSNLLKQDRDSKLNHVNFKVLDKMFGKVLEEGGQITGLIEKALPAIIESILAYHLNPRDGKSIHELAVELLWTLLEISQACYENLKKIEQEGLSLEELQKEFSGSGELTDGLKENLEAYRKEFNCDANDAVILDDRKFYVWLKIHREMTATLKVLMDKVLPLDLWDLYIPKQFDKLITRESVGSLFLDYLKEGYSRATRMKKMVADGKHRLMNEEAYGAGEHDEGSLQKFFRKENCRRTARCLQVGSCRFRNS